MVIERAQVDRGEGKMGRSDINWTVISPTTLDGSFAEVGNCT